MTKTEIHRAVERRELGYARDVCGTCGTDWPCPTVAQERARRAEQAPPCETDPEAEAELDHCDRCGVAEGGGPDGAVIMFDMLSGEHRCGDCFPDTDRYDSEPRRNH